MITKVTLTKYLMTPNLKSASCLNLFPFIILTVLCYFTYLFPLVTSDTDNYYYNNGHEHRNDDKHKLNVVKTGCRSLFVNICFFTCLMNCKYKI